MDERVQVYLDDLEAEHRTMFDRVHRTILDEHPDAEVVWSYQMPTYRVESGRRLHVAAWAHGLSFYGWSDDHDAGFAARHPDLRSGKGTLRLRPGDLEQIGEAELHDFVRAALAD